MHDPAASQLALAEFFRALAEQAAAAPPQPAPPFMPLPASLDEALAQLGNAFRGMYGDRLPD